jgi:hypothetical protein
VAFFGPDEGSFQGAGIPSYIITGDDVRHDFVGIGESPFDMDQLAPDESVIAPGLIYRRAPPKPLDPPTLARPNTPLQ